MILTGVSEQELKMLLAGICSATTPFVLLGDVLDCLPLDQCDKIFSFVEENVSTWKSVSNSQPLSEGRYFSSILCPIRSSFLHSSLSQSSFYTAGKNYLLRMCNGNYSASFFFMNKALKDTAGCHIISRYV